MGALEAETAPIIARLTAPSPAVAGWDHVAAWPMGETGLTVEQQVDFVSGELDGVAVSVLTV